MLRIRSVAAAVLGLAWLGFGDAAAQTLSVLGAGPINGPQGIALDGDGNLYVVNTQTRAGQDCTIAKFTPTGTATTFYADHTGCQHDGVAIDASGNVFVADTLDSRIIEITQGGAATNFVDSAAGINFPNGLVFDKAGNLYVSSIRESNVLKVSPAGGVTTFVPASVGLESPDGMAFDAEGNLYIACDGGNESGEPAPLGAIAKITPAGIASAFATASQTFVAPSYLAFDRNGNLFAAQNGNLFIGEDQQPKGAIFEITPDRAVTLLDSQNFVVPTGIAFDAGGDLLVADQQYNSLSRVAPDDGVTLVYGGTFAGPQFLAYDSTGTLYVSNAQITLQSNKRTATGMITKIAPNGTATQLVGGSQRNWAPEGLAVDAAGNVYVADAVNGAIDKVAPDGTMTTFVGAGQGLVEPEALAFGPDGNLYVADPGASAISRVAPSGSVSKFVSAELPFAIAFDRSGNLYVSSGSGSAIARIAPDGNISNYGNVDLPTHAQGLAVDAGGNLYYAGIDLAGVVKIAPDGTATVLVDDTLDQTVPLLEAPVGVVLDSSNHLVIADSDSNVVYRVSFDASPLAAAVLPSSRTPLPNQAATLFATILNTSDTDQTECGVGVSQFGFSTAPGSLNLYFQTTDPTTNALTGIPDVPVPIPAHGAQTFFVSIYDGDAVYLPNQPFLFYCQNVTPAPSIVGVNTVDLDFATDINPAPDVIVISATTSRDGTLHLAQDIGAFAIATDNLGTPGSLTLTADTGTATLPITLALCQTDQSAQCLATPAGAMDVSFPSGSTPTFSIFAASTGPIGFDPANARIFVRFKDAQGIPHGSTSVAVTTQ